MAALEGMLGGDSSYRNLIHDVGSQLGKSLWEVGAKDSYLRWEGGRLCQLGGTN
jgi:hypothetical protein